MVSLTLDQIVESPDLISYDIVVKHGDTLYLRPLKHDDVDLLASFLESLSPLTRHRWLLDDYGLKGAKSLCDAIALYDKLRLVVVESNIKGSPIVGLMEFSLDMHPNDIERFEKYGITLNNDDYMRFGPCLRDDVQGTGLFSATMPFVIDTALKLGRSSMILWGGVLEDNVPAIRAYEKIGFREIGRFTEPDTGLGCIDMILDLNR